MVQVAYPLSILRQVILFQDISPASLELMLQHMTEQCFPTGEIVFHEGDQGDRFFLILEGKMHIYVKRQGTVVTYTRLQHGGCFGEMALIDDGPRSATVQAEEPSRCLTLSKQDFNVLLATYPQLALGVMKNLSQRLRQISEQIQEYVQQG